MTSIDKGANLGNHEDPEIPPIAHRRVPKQGILNRFLRRTTLVELPQHYPAKDRAEHRNFDFAYLMSTGAIGPEKAPMYIGNEPPVRTHEISDQAGALALRKAAEDAHRTVEHTPPQNFS